MFSDVSEESPFFFCWPKVALSSLNLSKHSALCALRYPLDYSEPSKVWVYAGVTDSKQWALFMSTPFHALMLSTPRAITSTHIKANGLTWQDHTMDVFTVSAWAQRFIDRNEILSKDYSLGSPEGGSAATGRSSARPGSGNLCGTTPSSCGPGPVCTAPGTSSPPRRRWWWRWRGWSSQRCAYSAKARGGLFNKFMSCRVAQTHQTYFCV